MWVSVPLPLGNWLCRYHRGKYYNCCNTITYTCKKVFYIQGICVSYILNYKQQMPKYTHHQKSTSLCFPSFSPCYAITGSGICGTSPGLPGPIAPVPAGPPGAGAAIACNISTFIS